MATTSTSAGPVTSAPSRSDGSGAARLGPGEHATAVLFGLWMVVGLFLDGWAHDSNRPESFFTPWHAVLYSGFAAAAFHAVLVVNRRRPTAASLRAAIPSGHRLTLGGVAIFAVAAAGDLVWHEAFGVEVGVEALLSPTHLLLFVSGALALSGPLRDAWAHSEPAQALRSFLPVVFSAALLAAVSAFFLVYVSPISNDAGAAGFDRLAEGVHDHPSTDPRELLQLLGVASILMTTVILTVPLRLLSARWRPPVGTFAILDAVVITLISGLDGFEHWSFIPVAALAGFVADLMLTRRGTTAAAATSTAVLWLGYFATFELTEGDVRWTAELWMGSVVMAVVVAAASAARFATTPVPRLETADR